MVFEWDESKRESNLKKHGIDFTAAILIFGNNPYVFSSPRGMEDRLVAVGEVAGRVIAVVYTERIVESTWVTRIISARRARKHEEKDYKTRKGA